MAEGSATRFYGGALQARGARGYERQEVVSADIDGDDLNLVRGRGGVLLTLADEVDGTVELSAGRQQIRALRAGNAQVNQLEPGCLVAIALL